MEIEMEMDYGREKEEGGGGRSGGWGAGVSVGYLWQGRQCWLFFTRLCRACLGLNILCVSGTWQLYASTDGGDNGRRECAIIERETMLLC